MGLKDLFVTKHKGIHSAKKRKRKGIHNLKLRGICVRVSTLNTLRIVQTCFGQRKTKVYKINLVLKNLHK